MIFCLILNDWRLYLVWKGEKVVLKIAICDDSRMDVDILESALDKFCQYPVYYDVYYHGEELLVYLDSYEEYYHVYLLDIEMPEINGLELAKQIRERDVKALFIFLTNYSQYVMDVFEVVTFDYIMKPITYEKLEAMLVKSIHYLDMVKKVFTFWFRKQCYQVFCDEIFYIQKKGRQAFICTKSEIYHTNMTIEEIWTQLDERIFFQINKSCIINFEYMKTMSGNEVILKNGDRFLVVRPQRNNLRKKHIEFIKRMV